jgi:hypothetical protein
MLPELAHHGIAAIRTRTSILKSRAMRLDVV